MRLLYFRKVYKVWIFYILSILGVVKMSYPNPFNPRIPAHPDGFIGRETELAEFVSCLNSTIQKSPMSMAIVGNRGIGKTSFLAKCEDIVKENNCIAIRFSSIEGGFESIEDICSYILVQIQNEVVKRSKLELLKKSASEFFNKYDFKISYKDFGVELKKSAAQSALQTLFREKLFDIWKHLESNCNGVVIMIDEAEIIEVVPGALMFLREVFSRLGEQRSPFMLVVSGKLAFPDKMSEKFSPLARFFHPIALHNFSKEESSLLLKTKLKLTGVVLSQDVLAKIFEESEGHPYVLVAIAYVLYENLPEGDSTITLKHYEAIRPKITSYLNADYFGVMYKGLSPTGRIIMKNIAKLGGEATFSSLIQSIGKSKGTISPVIPELVERGSLIKLDRGKYRIFHSRYKEYLLVQE